MDSGKEVVLFVVEDIILHRHTRSHEFGDTSLHEFLGELRILQLVTDGNTLTCPDQLRKIGVKGMMGESCHLVTPHPCSIVTTGQGNA